MKKFIILFGISLWVSASWAVNSLLYWTLDFHDWDNYDNTEAFKMHKAPEKTGTYDVWLVAENGDLKTYFNPVVTITLGSADANIGGAVASEIGGLSDLEGYSFYVQIGVIGSSSYEAIWTSVAREYDTLSPYHIQFGETSPVETVWNAAAIPEPVSGILLIMGLMGLALRRKRM